MTPHATQMMNTFPDPTVLVAIFMAITAIASAVRIGLRRPKQVTEANSPTRAAERSGQALVSFIGPDLWRPLTDIGSLARSIADGTANEADIRDYARRIEQDVTQVKGAAHALFEILRIEVDGAEIETAAAARRHVTPT